VLVFKRGEEVVGERGREGEREGNGGVQSKDLVGVDGSGAVTGPFIQPLISKAEELRGCIT